MAHGIAEGFAVTLRRGLAVLLLSALLAGAGAASAASPSTTRAQAISIVKKLLRSKASACHLTIRSVSATRITIGWRVAAKVTTFGARGTSLWNVKGTKAVPADPLAADIKAGCP